MIEPGQLILLISQKGKRYLRKLEQGGEVHTHDGKLLMDDAAEAGFGQHVKTHLGRPYLILKPTLHDLIKGVKRQTQIMYPKEIGYLMMKLGIGPGSTVIESGTGSGGLTTALAWFVGDTGKVITYERRADFFKLAGKNLERVGLSHRVEQINQNIEDGFLHSGADALFLDVRTPWEYLHSIPQAVIPGAMCGFLLPTVNQVSELLRGLEDGPFAEMEVLEILVRRWKPVADRLRPDDRMVAHTGFLVFARYMEPPQETPKSLIEPSAAPLQESSQELPEETDGSEDEA
ncbi:tRNA (adenine(58)-N(1))-methyltransferase TrmI [Pseudodesulfovibrio profundus]|uniref:tRNA (adenine(58)-N(1))-methyltransferase TrmI n=1 Tax=Pseudodesulfovibrio profundus TaxID=57320 RepID=A0A2C8FA64_9BACT|nr:tRNA (adenine-N1)-methyltransferase [Pseudodesulfovibrio profundus]MBC17644.1 tRNA (adenine-N1)-methyltransferase [Desulfovibrio sp.]SOB59034.1 tRNA (adenine(58)-N(1))-methyltransferase TrmI [Pseudodesulfovibrio profundus]|tara:strand:+ start:15446 stop:16312 length:867 start_codon:yes stop_codon:yes gene_type:complete